MSAKLTVTLAILVVLCALEDDAGLDHFFTFIYGLSLHRRLCFTIFAHCIKVMYLRCHLTINNVTVFIMLELKREGGCVLFCQLVLLH